jgi:hypothetical protein
VYSAAGTVKHQMRCNSCHGYYSISETAKKGYDESMKKKKKNGSCK